MLQPRWSKPQNPTKPHHFLCNPTRKLAPLAYGAPPDDEHERHERQHCPYTAQERTRARKSHGPKHLVRHQGEDTPEHIATKALCRKGRRGVLTVRIGKVVEDSEVNAKDTHCGAPDGEGGDDPWNGRVSGGDEPEKTDGEEGGLDAGDV